MPFVATTFGWLLTELGRQPWIVQGLLKTSNANSPAVATTWLAISLTVFVSLYVILGVLDIWLMRRYAGRDPSTLGGEPGEALADSGDRLLMDLQNLWFVLIVVLWSGYFLLEGFDFGVGMLLPFLPRDDDERGAMFASIGPGLGRQRGVAGDGGRRDVRGVPRLVRDDVLGPLHRTPGVLVFLIIRVISFEWRTKSERPGWRKAWLWANAVGSFGAALDLGRRPREPAVRDPDQLERRLRRVILGSVQRLHRARGARGGVDLRLPRGDLPHLAHPG